LMTLEAGGAVRFGERAWAGEDPALLPESAAPTVAAGSAELADAIVRTLGGVDRSRRGRSRR
ncbi:MAG TPA: hypothetical protein VIL20_10195, partial [Sandaracinaceae bacterium]